MLKSLAPVLTQRLRLEVVLPDEYPSLLELTNPESWESRGIRNPYGHLITGPSPVRYRWPRIQANPEHAPYFLRLAVLRDSGDIIGSSGFHDVPDAEGMIEIGLGVVEAHRGQGFAQEILRGMWEWVLSDPAVKSLRYTVSPDNAPSQAIIAKFGFPHLGIQIDEEDGPEDIYEMSASEYRRLFG